MTARKKPTPPITVDAGQCLSLLTNVARAAGTDDFIPSINGVLLHGAVHDGKPVLVATATDRFILIQASVDATGEPLPEVFVSLPEVKRVAAVLKALPRDSKLLEVAAPGGGVASFSARGASVEVEPSPAAKDWGGFPDLAKLFEVPELAEGVEANKVALNGVYLTKLTAMAKALGEHMRVETHGPSRVVHVLVGERYRALIMPVRGVDGATTLPVFAPPSELKRAEAKAAEVEAAKTRHPAGKKPAARKAPARTPVAKPAPRRTSRAKAAA